MPLPSGPTALGSTLEGSIKIRGASFRVPGQAVTIHAGNVTKALAEFPVKIGDIECQARLKAVPDFGSTLEEGFIIEVEFWATSAEPNIGKYLTTFLSSEVFDGHV